MNREPVARVGGYGGRPGMAPADRMSAMKRYNPSTAAMLSSLSGCGDKDYNFATFDNLLNAINGWFEGLDKLSDPSANKRKHSEEESSGEERVHKTPGAVVVKQSLQDVVMDDAPHVPVVTEIRLENNNKREREEDNDSANSVGSDERIRPETPPNLFRDTDADDDHEMTHAVNPTSPPAKRMEELDIHTPPGVLGASPSPPVPLAPPTQSKPSNTVAGLTPALATPTSNPSVTPFLDPLERMRSPLATASNISLPPTPHPHPTEQPILDDKAYTVVKAETIEAQQIQPVNPPTPLSDANTVVSQSQSQSQSQTQSQSTKQLTSSSSSASIKKRPKLSNRTILDSLMEKKARNAIYYDGEAQKFFHELVLEMSQQIQAVKKERRMVMFAKDPACSNSLEKFDKTLQDCLKIVETGSFKWLKGRPDWKEMKGMRDKMAQMRKEAEDFKKSGWLPGGDDSTEEEDDDDSDASVDLEM